jgi:hypothetical protein
MRVSRVSFQAGIAGFPKRDKLPSDKQPAADIQSKNGNGCKYDHEDGRGDHTPTYKGEWNSKAND